MDQFRSLRFYSRENSIKETPLCPGDLIACDECSSFTIWRDGTGYLWVEVDGVEGRNTHFEPGMRCSDDAVAAHYADLVGCGIVPDTSSDTISRQWVVIQMRMPNL